MVRLREALPTADGAHHWCDPAKQDEAKRSQSTFRRLSAVVLLTQDYGEQARHHS